MTEIALAYSSIDKARAEAIARVLGALGYTLSAQPLTTNAVDSAAALVVFWSSGSVNSIPINQFAAQASAERKLVSVRAGAADPPAAYALVALHDLSRWTGSLEAPELRTFLQHVMRMAPSQQMPQQGTITPATIQQRPPAAVTASNSAPYAFAGPLAAAQRQAEAPRPTVQEAPRPVPAPTPRPAAPPSLQSVPRGDPPPPRPVRRVELKPEERPSARRVEERRRAAGGGVARVAFGAIAVSVIAGAAVAAFNYDPGQQSATSTGPDAGTNISVAPNTMVASGPTPGAVTDAAPEPTPAAGVQVASAEPLPAPLATPEAAATVQSARGWTATLPTTVPNTARAQPVSATTSAPTTTSVHAGAAPAPRPNRAPVRLTPIDAQPTAVGIVAVDGANLTVGAAPNTLQDNSGRPRSQEEERAWIRKQTTYGPDN